MSVERIALAPGLPHRAHRQGRLAARAAMARSTAPRPSPTWRAFLDAGIDAFDCADIYTGVEEMIGEASSPACPPRRRRRIGCASTPSWCPIWRGSPTFRPEEAEAIIDRSLKRLRIERLHLVQAFWWDCRSGMPVERAGLAEDLQAKGKIAHLGVTNWDSDADRAVLRRRARSSSRRRCSIPARPAPRGGLPTGAPARDIGLICYGVLAGGFLTEAWLGKPDPGFAFENRSLMKYRLIIDEFGGWEAVSGSAGRRSTPSPASMACRSVRRGDPLGARPPGVACAIVGARTPGDCRDAGGLRLLRSTPPTAPPSRRVMAQRQGPTGPVYGLESDRAGRHGRIMKYNLNTAP
jgi:aryl-alcohol dehydrogenase-like predicted oxidoreductase